MALNCQSDRNVGHLLAPERFHRSGRGMIYALNLSSETGLKKVAVLAQIVEQSSGLCLLLGAE
jgi:hypothetical protein